MAKISTELEAQIKSAPQETFNLIVKTTGDPAPHANWLTAQGMQVTRQFRLTPGVAVTCSGAEAQSLLEQDWVVSVELDQPVSAF